MRMSNCQYAPLHVQAARREKLRQAQRALVIDRYASWNATDELYCCPRCSYGRTLYTIWKRVGDRYDRFVTQVRCTRCLHEWQSCT